MKHFKESGISKPNRRNYFDYDEDYHGEIAFILQRVIKETEVIEFVYADDCNGEWYLVYTPKYPQIELPKTESQLTEEKVKKILKKYIALLTKQEIEITYHFIGNGG